MAEDAWRFAVTVPAGTVIAAPQTTPTLLPPCIVEQVHYRIPPGANGQVGFRITMRKEQVIPAANGQWIVDSATSGSFTLRELPDTGDWSVTAYNLGAFPHTVHVTYAVRYLRKEHPKVELASLSELSLWPGADAGLYPPGLWG